VALKNPANRHRTQMLTPEEFHYGFTTTRTLEESRPIYDRLAVPGPGRPLLFQAAFANFTPHAARRVDRHNSSRAPLLFLANGKDHTVPAVSTRAAYKVQKKTGALTELKEYPERSRSTFAQDGWEEVADYSFDWAVRNARTQPQHSGSHTFQNRSPPWASASLCTLSRAIHWVPLRFHTARHGRTRGGQSVRR
jgi:hypothetical protein